MQPCYIHQFILVFLLVNLCQAQDSLDDPHFIMDAYYYSKISYCQMDKVQIWKCGYDCQKFQNIDHVRTLINETLYSKGYTAYNKATNQIIKAYPICGDGCKIHRGFMYHYQSLENSMIKNVLELHEEYPSASVILTGHSLGGVVATLALPTLEAILPQNVKITLINFGTPKVGNDVFASWLNNLRSSAVRIVKKGDIIPLIPPFKQFVHSWKEIDEALILAKLNSSQTEGKELNHSHPGGKDHLNYFGIYTGCTEK